MMSHLEEGNGIYITLAYVCEASPKKDDRIYEYKTEGFNYEVEEEMYDYYESHEDYINYFGIFSADETVFLKYHEFDELGYNDTTNYGINIKKVNGEYVYRWGNHGGAACNTPPIFDEFSDIGDFDDFLDLSNPVNQIVGYIMSGDPTYITSYKGARSLIMKVERDELVEEMLLEYIFSNAWDEETDEE